MTRPAFCALLAAGLLGGCREGEPVLLLSSWRLGAPGLGGETAVRLPGHLEGLLPGRPAYYFLHTEVELPPSLRGRPLTLAFPELPALCTVRVDGVEVPSQTSSVFDRYRTGGPQRFRLPPRQAPTLTLDVRVEYRWVRAGWIDAAPRLSSFAHGDPGYLVIAFFNQASPLCAAAAEILLAVLYLLMFLNDRRRTAHAWFLLISLTLAYYSLFWVGLTQAVFGLWDIPLLGVSLILSFIFSVYFSHRQFGLPGPSRLWLFALVPLLGLAIALHGPFAEVEYLSAPISVLGLWVGIYQSVMLARLARRRPETIAVRAHLAAWIVLGLTAWTDVLGWLGAGPVVGGLRGGFVGIAICLLLQAAALSREHITTLLRSDELNRELEGRIRLLEGRNREIQVLNEELKRQVGERSRGLTRAIERLGSSAGEPTAFAPGDLVEGRYRIVRTLGSGGMGIVYEVVRIADARPLALKLLRGRGSRASLVRFTREAEIAARLHHPNVVSIVDIDVTRRGDLYFVMELVRGSTLEQEQSRFGDLGFGLPVLHQVAEGLAAIHRQGVVHRDLKPANVLLAPGLVSGTVVVKIADFGIASLRAVTEPPSETPRAEPVGGGALPHADTLPGTPVESSRLTRTGIIMGTPPYMAPELLQGAKAATAQSDVYSFGVVAYQVLAGSYPTFERRPGGGVAPLSLALRAPRLAGELARLVDRCLELDPAARPATDELAAVLAAAATTPAARVPSLG